MCSSIRFAAASALALTAGAAFGDTTDEAPAPILETDTYRHADTYASLRGTTPDACAAACAEAVQCQAWTLTPPLFTGGPRCELKRSMGRSEARPGATSGISPRILNTPAPSAPKPARPESAASPHPAVSEPVDRPPAVTPPMSDPAISLRRRLPPETIRKPEPASPPSAEPPAPSPASQRPPAKPEAGALPAVSAPKPPPLIARPADPSAAAVAPPGPEPQPHSSPTVREEGLKPLPARQGLPALPKPQFRSYSVQRKERVAGDVESTAGFVDGVPEEAGVHPLADPETYDEDALFKEVEPGSEDRLGNEGAEPE